MIDSFRQKYEKMLEANRYTEPDFVFHPDYDMAYEENGNVICGVCGKPLSVRISGSLAKMGIFDDRSILTVCDCHRKAHDKYLSEKEKKKNDDYIASKIQDIRKRSILGDKYKHSSFEDFDMGVSESIQIARFRAEKYCENAEECIRRNLGMYIYGSVSKGIGTGKSMLLGCMANRLMSSMYTVFVSSFSDISNMIKSTYKQSSDKTEEDIMKIISDVDFLMIDDMGTETSEKENSISPWMVSKIYDIVNTRYNSRKPIIASGNLKFDELRNIGYTEPIISRLDEMLSAIVKCEGESYRKKMRQNELPF